MKQINRIEKYVKENMDEFDWVHTKGVRIIAEELAGLEKADKDIVDIAALFHDISKAKVSPIRHAKESAKMAKSFLKKMKYNDGFIERAVECVAAHSSPWTKNAPMPKSIEAKVVFDADMLQQLSSFGIIKHILKYKKKTFKEIIKNSEDDLANIAFKLLLTKNGKRIGRSKVRYVKEFFKLTRESY